MRRHVPETIPVKAAMVNTLDELLEARAAGAARIGTSATGTMLAEWKARLEAPPGDARGTGPQSGIDIIGVGGLEMPDDLNRRDFLKAAAIAGGPVAMAARGANDKINIGWIGVGTRGYAGIELAAHGGARRRADHRHLRYLPGLHRARHRPHEDDLGQHAQDLRGLSRLAGRQEHRRGLHHDARAPAPRYGHRGA